jgi:hypothetical protein
MVKRFSRKGWYGGGDMGTQGQPVVERAAAGGGAGVLGQGDAVDGGVMEAHAVPRGHEARHGRWLLVGALRASPLLAHGAEADAVAEGVEAFGEVRPFLTSSPHSSRTKCLLCAFVHLGCVA